MEVAKLGECHIPAAGSSFAPLKEQSLPAVRCIADDRMMGKWRESSTLPLGQPMPMVLSQFHIHTSPVFLLKKLCSTHIGYPYSPSLWMQWLRVSLHMTSSDE